MSKKLTDLTPAKFRCAEVSSCCPAVFATDSCTYIVIGKLASIADYPDLAFHLGKDEVALEIPAELLEEAAVLGFSQSRPAATAFTELLNEAAGATTDAF